MFGLEATNDHLMVRDIVGIDDSREFAARGEVDHSDLTAGRNVRHPGHEHGTVGAEADLQVANLMGRRGGRRRRWGWRRAWGRTR